MPKTTWRRLVVLIPAVGLIVLAHAGCYPFGLHEATAGKSNQQAETKNEDDCAPDIWPCCPPPPPPDGCEEN